MNHNRKLKCQLSPSEIHERLVKLGKTVSSLLATEEELKETSRRLQTKIERLHTRVAELTRITDTGKEIRVVVCRDHVDLSSRMMVTIRTDTNEEVNRRPATADEVAEAQQTTMFFAEAE